MIPEATTLTADEAKQYAKHPATCPQCGAERGVIQYENGARLRGPRVYTCGSTGYQQSEFCRAEHYRKQAEAAEQRIKTLEALLLRANGLFDALGINPILADDIRNALLPKTEPRIGNVEEMIESLRKAGGDGWDKIDDPETFLGRK